MLENRTLLIGDVLEKMQVIPDEEIHVIMSSPPYWNLRDYGIDGQWGLEKNFKDYLKLLQKFMDECKRVLKKDGTIWINLGDTYNGTGDHSKVKDAGKATSIHGIEHLKKKGNYDFTIQRKSRYGIPERFYADCIDNGWVARNHIAWYKSNAMPQSVKDRLSNKWESIFFFAKNPQYYFDLKAIKIKPKSKTTPFNLRVRESKKGRQMKFPTSTKMSEKEDEEYDEDGIRKMSDVPGQSTQGIHRNRTEGKPDWIPKQDQVLGPDGKPKKTHAGFNQRWKYKETEGEPHSQKSIKERMAYARNVEGKDHDGALNNPDGKNPGDVIFADFTDGELLEWIKLCREDILAFDLAPDDVFMINPRPFTEAHFATYPLELPTQILKAACPKNGFVLDPFFGAGTTALAAEKLGLNWIGIELKQEYADIALKRLKPHIHDRLESFLDSKN